MDDLYDELPEREWKFRYWLQGDGIDQELRRHRPLGSGDTFQDERGEWLVAESIGPPEPDGVRPVVVRRLHPLPTDP